MSQTVGSGQSAVGRGKLFTGVFTPIVTPFTSADVIDEKGLADNVRRWMTTPLTGLVVLGSNGEAPQLEDAEADRAIEIVRAGMPKDRPLIAGTGRESTKATIEATHRAAALGADAALVRTPSFFKNAMTSEVFIRHYAEVADASRIPVLLYNVTMYTGVTLQADAVEQLSAHPNIVGMKESGNDLILISECVARTPDDFTVLAGSATTLFQSLCAGCDGAILAVASLLPDECVRLVRLVQENKIAEARALQRTLMPIARSVGGGFGIPGLKAALDLLGFRGGMPRPPLRPASKQITDTIRGQLDALGVLPVRV
jgi:4-hydroxy-2-oxoglutarate aldolase